MALSFIGKPISLISHSDVRYRGILAGIDPVASTIQLSNVYSMGTESRRPPNEFIPPVQEPYQYIIFRASEVKDLAVDEPVPQRSVHDDPAVLGASAPGGGQAPNNGFSPYPTPPAPVPVPVPGAPPTAPTPQQQPPQQPQQQPQQQQNHSRQGQGQQAKAAPNAAASGGSQTPQPGITQPTQQQPSQNQQQQQRNNNRRTGGGANAGASAGAAGGNSSVQNAAASLESVERALGDLRVSNATTTPQNQNSGGNAGAGGGGRRRNGGGGGGAGGAGGRNAHQQHQQQNVEQIKVPTTDFDFESMNAKFNKAALVQQQQALSSSNNGEPDNGVGAEGVTGTTDSSSVVGGDGTTTPHIPGTTPSEKKPEAAYNPQKSFFDSLSSSTSAPGPPAGRGGGGRGRGGGGGGGPGGGGRNRREEERERNVATFGEPGGVGLMGPGAYVGGWGGYGRRGGGAGGGRPRRGGAGGGGGGQGVSARG